MILDEPTNDLDLLTLGILEEFLLNYKGCLIIVSHDRYFMDKLVDHLFIFEGNGVIKDYNGTYTEWRMVEEEKEKEAARAKNKEVEEQKKRDNTNKGDKKKLSYKERLEYENLGKAIELLEKEKLGLEDQMGGTEATHIQLQEWAVRMEQVIQEIDEKSMRWLELSELA